MSEPPALSFEPTALAGVVRIAPIRREDERGFFARTWCAREFADHGLVARLTQCSISFNHRAATLRGMHYQADPHGEVKVVRCTAGAIYDVVLDLRPRSASYKQWIAAELSAENRHMLYIPEGCAHGFQTLADRTEVFYQMANDYVPAAARGVRWNDPAFGIRWPEADRIISRRDQDFPDFHG